MEDVLILVKEGDISPLATIPSIPSYTMHVKFIQIDAAAAAASASYILAHLKVHVANDKTRHEHRGGS